MKNPHQCEQCDAAISGEAWHLIAAGKIFRFCSHQHRQEYRRARLQLVVRQTLLPKPQEKADA